MVRSHGNSKSGIPFHPTWSSTKKHIKEKCATEGPKSVVASLSAEVGGVLEAIAPGQLPRNEKQVTNYRSRVLLEQRHSCIPGTSRDVAADDLFMIMQKCFTEDPSKKFVRAVNAAPEPAVVVTTDRQLQDLARFCTTTFEFSPLTVDPTFNLGDFDVTIITYHHLLVHSKWYKIHQCLLDLAAFTTRRPSRLTFSLHQQSLVSVDSWKVCVLLVRMGNKLYQMPSNMNLALRST